MQFQADVLGIPIERPAVLDASALCRFAAGFAVGFWQDHASLTASRQIDRTVLSSEPLAQAKFTIWQKLSPELNIGLSELNRSVFGTSISCQSCLSFPTASTVYYANNHHLICTTS